MCCTIQRIVLSTMPATRLLTRSASSNILKRKLSPPESPQTPKKLKAARVPTGSSGTAAEPEFVPADAVLTFSFEDAKKHLINADHRFEDIFNKLPCTPFQQLEQVHPFRALARSILGQQISTLAARSIQHRFIRLYDPNIPEHHSDYSGHDAASFFPSPQQVAETDISTLRSAGLSARKAEYIVDLAARFADGRLSTRKLIESDDDELAEMLLEVRGIGPWTVDMFAIFSLRRPDILPVGDLGVQRGIARWALAQHSPSDLFTVSPEKNLFAVSSEKKKAVSPAKRRTKKSNDEDDALPVFGTENVDTLDKSSPVEDASALVPLPPTFTPSINKILEKADDRIILPLPEGLTVAELKSRLSGKKKVKGAFLSPTHMEELTAGWRPYRSIGVYYMWALADAEKSSN
ncbi:DNA glycosylase [Mycena pura]|uniref:DNA glycosylase n=1 Tax=Mycena pura TaxID=153505 RepID=A0AAD6VVM4_9AGAR|nr:DNA glycosylase [Mycena pura]